MIKKGPWILKSEQSVYQNPWIDIRHQEVITPAGSDGIYGVVSFKNIAVGVVALNEKDEILLVKQYRYPLETLSIEIPEGGCPKNDSPLEAAQRELLEETGTVANTWQEIQCMDLSNSITDERAVIYLATGLKTVQTPTLEDSESDLEHFSLPFAEAIRMVDNGEITDAISVVGILRAVRIRPELLEG